MISIHRKTLLLLPLLLGFLLLTGSKGMATAGFDVIVYVSAANGNDANPCASNMVFATLQRAADCAIENKKVALSTLVNVAAGTYREVVDLQTYTNHPSNQPNNETPISFAADPVGSVTLSASEIWDNWQGIGSGRFTHEWLYDWGFVSADIPQAPVPPISQRQEVIVVDGTLLRQVLTTPELVDGTFHIDEAADLITIAPVNGTFNTVEVGVQPWLWWQEHENNITIRGFNFQHATTPWLNGRAAVRLNESDNILLEDVTISWNNGDGLLVTVSENITTRRVAMDYNGKSGINAWRMQFLTLINSSTSFNNWRGNWGDYAGWWLGNKFFSVHDLTIEGHKARGNLSRGLWLDYDIERATINNSSFDDNLRDGLFIEASPGPVTVQNSRFTDNGEYGLKGTLSHQVHLAHLHIKNNFLGGLFFAYDASYPDGRVIQNFVTQQEATVVMENWSLNDSAIAHDNQGSAFLVGSNLPEVGSNEHSWPHFVQSLQANNNSWIDTQSPNRFQLPGTLTDLCGWRLATNQEAQSQFAPISLACAGSSFAYLIQLPIINVAP